MTKRPCPQAVRPSERVDKRGPLNSIVALTHAKGGAVEHPEFVVFKELHKNWFEWEQQFKRNAETRLWLDEATGTRSPGATCGIPLDHKQGHYRPRSCRVPGES